MNETRMLTRVGLLATVLCTCGCGTSCPRAPEEAAQRSKGSAPSTCVDGAQALSHVRRIVELGPRPPGSPALEQTRQYLESKLRELRLVPQRHPFTARTPHPRYPQVEMANVTVDVAGSGPGKVLLGAHFDGKLLEGLRFVGANDGGSSAALLLELARCLVAHPPPCTVTLAFFDGEEALVEWSDRDSLYGSKNLALELRASGALREVRAMVLVDMIGDADLHLFRETLSTPWVQQILMEAALSAGHGELWSGPRGAIEDDHLPFLQSGVPAAVMIDLNYGPKGGGNDYWHTEEDTLDKLSPDSLQAVGETLLHALPKLCQGKRG